MQEYAPLNTFLMPGWSVHKIAQYAVDRRISCEVLPDPNNRVMVTASGQIQLSCIPNHLCTSKRLVSRLAAVLNRLYLHNHLVERRVYIANSLGITAVGHQAGTCRFRNACGAEDGDGLVLKGQATMVSSQAPQRSGSTPWGMDQPAGGASAANRAPINANTA